MFTAKSTEHAPLEMGQAMKTPRAAAIAGIVSSVLLTISQVLIRISIPSNPLGPALDVISHSKTISLALNLLPFAGISFLWFIAAIGCLFGLRFAARPAGLWASHRSAQHRP